MGKGSHDVSAEQRLVVRALEVEPSIDDLVSLFAGVPLADLGHAHDPAVVPFAGAGRLCGAAFGATQVDDAYVRGDAGSVGFNLAGENIVIVLNRGVTTVEEAAS
jgi:hypothetical protein